MGPACVSLLPAVFFVHVRDACEVVNEEALLHPVRCVFCNQWSTWTFKFVLLWHLVSMLL